MKNNLFSKIISAGIFAIITAIAMHGVHANALQIGKDAWLAKKAALYDRDYSHPDSIIMEIIVGLIIIGIFFALYELIAFVILKILEKVSPSDSNDQLSQ